MTRFDYIAILARAGQSQSWAGRVLANNAVSGRRWAAGTHDVSLSAQIVLRLLDRKKVTVEHIEAAANDVDRAFLSGLPKSAAIIVKLVADQQIKWGDVVRAAKSKAPA